MCTRSRYRLTWNQPQRQGPRKAACSLRCSPASVLCDPPLLASRLSVASPFFWKRLPCAGQSASVRRHICAKPGVSAALLFTAASQLAGRESLQSGWVSLPASTTLCACTAPPRCCIGRGSRNQQVKSRTADTLCVRTMGACFCRCGAQSSGPFQRSTTTCGKGSRQTATLFRPLIDACL